MTTKSFKSVEEIFIELTHLIRPPEDLTVSQAAAKYRQLNNPGSYVGPWLNNMVWPMVEPMDVTISRDFDKCVMVAPAQTGKTDGLILNNIVYSVKIDPMDMIVYSPSNTAARDFSIRRVERLHAHSEAIGDLVIAGQGDNIFDKRYTTGMLFSMSWPSRTEFAGKPIPRVFLTDRDRMEDDIDGDGDPFLLASKRTQSFGSYAMAVVESSPSRPVKDLKWIPQTLHEAPPCDGILGHYNIGDRRRWYWPCPVCGEYFEGLFTHLRWNEDLVGSNYEKALTVYMQCPHNGCRITYDDREEMQFWGRWIKDGESIDRDGNISGTPIRTRTASFWLRGVAACFVKWRDLVAAYLDAFDQYNRTGDEESLKKFYNNDLGEPYYDRASMLARTPESIKARAEKSTGFERHVPQGVRFLLQLVDVQTSKFVIQVFGICPGKPFDMVLIDRLDLTRSPRRNEFDEAERVQPHAYLEDWELITEAMNREYPLIDGSGRMMGIRFTACDSGGKAGVTSKAYEFWRSLVARNLHRRFILLKGDPKPAQPRARINYPDSNRKDMKSGARGDIPVLFLNSNILKDDLNGRLDCVEPGKGMYRMPDWLPDSMYNELCAEIREPKGWMNPAGHRNENWDLSYYCIGLCSSEILRIEWLDWNNPPPWAAEWDSNDFVRASGQTSPFAAKLESGYDLSDLGKALA